MSGWVRAGRCASCPDRLTPREYEVLTLVADGRSNREIGAALFISDRTVARHLTNIYNKIDVTSRTQAARYAIDHQMTVLADASVATHNRVAAQRQSWSIEPMPDRSRAT